MKRELLLNIKDSLTKIDKSLLELVLSKTNKDIEEEYNRINKVVRDETASLTFLGLEYIRNEVNVEAFIKSHKKTTLSDIDNTWNYIDYMFGEHEFSSKVFQVLPNERELRIHSDPLMKQFNKFMRINHPEVSEVILDKKQFDRTLKDKSYYKEARTVTIDGDTAYRRIIDVSKLIDELGEELIPNIINTVKGLEVKPTTKDGAMNSLIN